MSVSLPCLELLPTAIGVDVMNLGRARIGLTVIVKGFKSLIVCALDESTVVDIAVVILDDEALC